MPRKPKLIRESEPKQSTPEGLEIPVIIEGQFWVEVRKSPSL